MNKKNENLTGRQRDILDFIKQYLAEKHYPPSIRETCTHFNLNSPATVHAHVQKLIEKGYLKRGDNSNHLIELNVPNEYEMNNEEVVNVPLLGKITAGTPIEAIEVPNEFFALPAYLIPSSKEVFTLKVSGESMINAGIFDGDIVIVEKQNTAHNGEIVVAMTDENEVTLKTFYKEKDYFRLQPQNDYMNPIILKNVTILGKAIGLYRKF